MQAQGAPRSRRCSCPDSPLPFVFHSRIQSIRGDLKHWLLLNVHGLLWPFFFFASRFVFCTYQWVPSPYVSKSSATARPCERASGDRSAVTAFKIGDESELSAKIGAPSAIDPMPPTIAAIRSWLRKHPMMNASGTRVRLYRNMRRKTMKLLDAGKRSIATITTVAAALDNPPINEIVTCHDIQYANLPMPIMLSVSTILFCFSMTTLSATKTITLQYATTT